MATSSDKGKVAIVGSGIIGRAWSTAFSRAGYHVALYDAVPAQLSGAKDVILLQLQDIENKGLMKEKTAEEAFKLVTTCDDLGEALKGVFYVQECTPENVDLKKKVFTSLEEKSSSDSIILASSTSCIVPSKFTEFLRLKNRCIVAHPVNPPYLVPLVEVMPSPWTDSDVTERTLRLLKDIGQSPVLLKKEVPGFIANRLQYALFMEAWRLLEDGICSPEDIETTMTDGLGLRLSVIGILETTHLNANGVRDFCEKYGRTMYDICSDVTARPLAGDTLDKLAEDLNKAMPLDQLDERRKLRDKKLADMAILRAKQKEEQSK